MMTHSLKTLLTALFIVLAALPAQAVQPDEILEDPVLENRAREISKGLRCLVCQNQSIDDSDADLARDLRIIVRERLVEGDSDREVVDFVVDRYGDYVLLRTPLQGDTILLWASPLIILIIALLSVWYWYRSKQAQVRTEQAGPSGPAGKSLSAEEKARLDALLKDD